MTVLFRAVVLICFGNRQIGIYRCVKISNVGQGSQIKKVLWTVFIVCDNSDNGSCQLPKNYSCLPKRKLRRKMSKGISLWKLGKSRALALQINSNQHRRGDLRSPANIQQTLAGD